MSRRNQLEDGRSKRRWRRSVTYRLYPTARQVQALSELLSCQRELYNAALEERQGTWRWEHRRVSRFEQFGQLTGAGEVLPWLDRFGVGVARGTLLRLDEAFAHFFRRVRTGERPGFPRFRGAGSWDSAQWGDTHGWKLTRTGKGTYGRLYVQGVGQVKVKLHRSFGEGAEARKLVVRRRGRRWEATVSWSGVPIEPLPETGRACGVDVGVAVLAAVAADDGSVELVANPEPLAHQREALICAQRALAACTRTGRRDGGRRQRARARVARLHERIRNQRRHAAHQRSARLVATFDVIAIEGLPRRGLGTARPIPRVQGCKRRSRARASSRPRHLPNLCRVWAPAPGQPRHSRPLLVRRLRTSGPRGRQRGRRGPGRRNPTPARAGPPAGDGWARHSPNGLWIVKRVPVLAPNRAGSQDAGITCDALFRFEHVGVSGAGGDLLVDVDGALPAAGVTTVVGPSGSGKSTLLRLCNRLEAPTSGTVRFRGDDVAGVDPRELRRRVGMVFQRPTPFAGTVRDNLRVARPDVTDEDAKVALEGADLTPALLERPAHELSGGEAQRLCVARTLVTHPEVLLMDEPTSSLDGRARRALEDMTRVLADDGVPVVWVTHDLEQARRLTDYVVVLAEGRIEFAGAPDEARRKGYLGDQ